MEHLQPFPLQAQEIVNHVRTRPVLQVKSELTFCDEQYLWELVLDWALSVVSSDLRLVVPSHKIFRGDGVCIGSWVSPCQLA